MTADETKLNETSRTAERNVLYLLLPILIIVGALIAYKSSAALTVLTKVSTTGVFSPRGNVIPRVGASEAGVLTRTLNYFLVVWPALLFGTLISGAVSTFLPTRWLARILERRSVRSQAISGLIGAPLMLCSCCVAPIFTGVYEKSARLGPSLGLMLAAPALNPAALILTFMLFDYKIGITRVVASVTAVLFTGMIADKIFEKTEVHCDVGSRQPDAPSVHFLDFLRASARIATRVIPVLIIGVILSMIVAEKLPVQTLNSSHATFLVISIVAAFAVLLALPTFFELPLALILLGSGLPVGAAMAMLIAGPSVNLPSLLTIVRSTNWKIGVFVAACIWTLAVASGLLVSSL